MKKTVYLLLSGMLPMCMAVMLGLGLAACSSDDEELSNNESGVVDEFDEAYNEEPVYLNPLVQQEDGFSLKVKLSGENAEQTVFHGGTIGMKFSVDYQKVFEPFNAVDGKELVKNEHFFAIYTKDGKLFRKVDLSKIQVLTLLRSPIVHEFTYLTTLPPGDYYTKFTVDYNATPGAVEKTMKTHTFRMDFTVKE